MHKTIWTALQLLCSSVSHAYPSNTVIFFISPFLSDLFSFFLSFNTVLFLYSTHAIGHLKKLWMSAKGSDPKYYSYLPSPPLRPEVYGVSLEALLSAAAAGTRVAVMLGRPLTLPPIPRQQDSLFSYLCPQGTRSRMDKLKLSSLASWDLKPTDDWVLSLQGYT